MTVDESVITALCRLNGHARAYGFGKRAVYAYKTLVAALLAASGDVGVQLVRWSGPCDRCAGTGVYTFWEGGSAPCRHCARGTVTLKFVETTFPGSGVVWHHPFDTGSGAEISKAAKVAWWDGEKGRYTNADGNEPIFWNVASNWTPRLKGEQLNPDDAAMALNAVEEWLLPIDFGRTGPPYDGPHGPVPYWLASAAKREMRGYVIDLGRVGLKCWYCGSYEVVSGLCRMGPPFTWSAPVCREHQQRPVGQWPAQSELPPWMLTPPLEEWLARHERIGFEFAREWD